MKASENSINPLEYVHDILKGKWKTVILWQLRFRSGATTFQLKRSIKGISEKMLLEQLNELRLYGLVGKKNFVNEPFKVEYYLTEDKGKKLIKAFEIMEELGQEYVDGFKNE
ncbi:helix-turn-helix transcriptional regulator [Sedimentibacter sp. zth1]|uniref:winged helix-turn-helix transcriptional regulator n=1 Tax=Sedimentibacter sp. zth1 TaxID=2816908 RepID=UPI001A90DA7D|nr:helix-turn-helix domain-containing protein [Sedimentibacter sp. zth1]QSX06625.1 helix-turn-helix transcriptional regulator [Sedimentibacter sp. zth1]